MLLDEMEIFYRVVQLKSFAKAAQRLQVSKSFISKKVTKLEQHLQLNLLTRNTRHLSLTEVGKQFYDHCAKIVEEGEKAFGLLDVMSSAPNGTLKISIPPAFANYLVAPFLPEFLAAYPQLKIEAILESRMVDLVEEGYDLALRSAKLASSNLIAQRIYTAHSILCASERYLQENGSPLQPSDLSRHNIACYSQHATTLKLTKNGCHEIVSIRGNLVANQLDILKHMVLRGSCLAVLPAFMVSNELRSKQLVACLSDYSLSSATLYAIFPRKEYMPHKLKVFLAALKQHLAINHELQFANN